MINLHSIENSIIFFLVVLSSFYTDICGAQATVPFVTTWKTDNPGISANNQITIPTAGGGYNYTVDWGDGAALTVETGDATHTYAVPGTYTVSITGDFPGIAFANIGDKEKILSIEQWGDISWEFMNYAFFGCVNLVGNFVDAPDLSKISSTSYMFADALVFNTSLNNWDVSNITDMTGMFRDAESFNGAISDWDVSNVVDMTLLFASAVNFNQDIRNWQTGNVKNMRDMFYEATVFNQDISNWDVSNVTDMFAMFNVTEAFNQDIGNWDVSSVTDMRSMFSIATSFNQDISAWDVSNVTNMSNMFSGAKSFNQNINSWNISKVINIQWMFAGAETFNQYIGDWDVSNVTNMIGVFSDAISFNQDLNNWDTSNVDRMQWMFADTDAFNQDLSNWDVSNVTNMDGMFVNAIMFDQNIGMWNVKSLTTAKHMFEGAKLSVANYDALLISWNAQDLNKNVSFHGGNSKYCAGASARANMISIDNWIIIDDGLAAPSIDPLMDQNEIGSFTLPAITGADLYGNEAYFTGPNGTGTRYDAGAVIDYSDFPMYPVTLYIYVGLNTGCNDEQSFNLIINSVPFCTTLSSPLNGETGVSAGINLTWNTASEALGYKISVGTSSGGSDILSALDVGNTTTYDFVSDLPENSNIFVTIIPYNATGDAQGCGEENFRTEVAGMVPMCTTLSSPSAGDFGVLVDTDLIWNSVIDATGYKLIVGTSSGASDIVNAFDVGNTTTYDFVSDLPENTNIFVTVIPYNAIGDALSCGEEFFVTKGITIDNALPPKFFTPNNDFVNDYWIVPNPSNNIVGVYVYNRYGKLLKQLSGMPLKWNGIFNGMLMPNDDYWYFIQYRDGSSLKGHFSLIR